MSNSTGNGTWSRVLNVFKKPRRDIDQTDVNVAMAYWVAVAAKAFADHMEEHSSVNLKSTDNFKYLYCISLNLIRYLQATETQLIVALVLVYFRANRLQIGTSNLLNMLKDSTDNLTEVNLSVCHVLELEPDNRNVEEFFDYLAVAHKNLVRDVQETNSGLIPSGKNGLWFVSQIGLDIVSASGQQTALMDTMMFLPAFISSMRETAQDL
jgi:hypothetical protein